MPTIHSIAWPRRRWPFNYRRECDDILLQDEEQTSLLPPSSPRHHDAHKFLPQWYFKQPARITVLVTMTIAIGVAMIALGSLVFVQSDKSGGGNEEDVVYSRMSHILEYRPKLIVEADDYDVPPMTTSTTDLPLTLPCGASEIPLEDPVMQG